MSYPAASLASHSRFVQRVRRRFGDAAHQWADGAPRADSIARLIDGFLAQGLPLARALRMTRNLVIERLAVLDVEQAAPLECVTQGMTELAEVCLEYALQEARRELDLRYGAPQNEKGEVIDFWIVGMGKLGGRELNVSSDIDLIYVYEEEGATAGRSDGSSAISAHEYFAHLARMLYAFIGDTTEDGFVFRVDLALRPNGNSGPAAVSLSMLEEYFLVQGREWERFAWLKSRVIAPKSAVTSGRALQLRDLVVPFVFRRYLDYGVFEGLRQLHQKIRDEAQRRAAGRPERANDVKLSRGGIREIEFTVQLLQVVRGGQFPELRTRSTLSALNRLVSVGVMKPEVAQRLREAYLFLRRVEHRIQYLDDQQTHQLPTDDQDLLWMAQSMGLGESGNACQLIQELMNHREFVAAEFDVLLHDGRSQPSAPGAGCRTCSGDRPATLESQAFQDWLPPQVAQRVKSFIAVPRVAILKDESKQRLMYLIGRSVKLSQAMNTQAGSESGQDQDNTATLRFIDWLEPLLRRESYIALLAERPAVHERLLRLLGLARWPMRYLMQHPGVIDELADASVLQERFDRASFLNELQQRYSGWDRSGQADEDALMDTLRRAHHAEVFRTLVRDVESCITVEQVADDLSALADATLDCTMQWSWRYVKTRHRETPRFAIIAYGKLGGKELGYGSDLDVVFLYDDEDERAGEIYAAYARKLITWLTLRTAAGDLFDIDTALRPNGNSGLLVTTMEAFERYQTQRGSNTAWTWEHQAITRARWCAGDRDLIDRFEQTRRTVLCAPREADSLRQEIMSMRQKVRDAHPVKATRFDVKHSPGGMMDAEFVVQYLVLNDSQQHPELQDNVGNIALLQRAERCGLLPAGVGVQAATAYRELRRAQHKARLDEASTQFDITTLGELEVHRQAIKALTQAVFGTV